MNRTLQRSFLPEEGVFAVRNHHHHQLQRLVLLVATHQVSLLVRDVNGIFGVAERDPASRPQTPQLQQQVKLFCFLTLAIVPF
jgi:hypothetical protein